MTLVDWVILGIIVLSVLTAAHKGFFVECFSLAGVILGLLLASWNYQRLVPYLMGWVHTVGVAQAIAFVVIALGTMIVAGIIGRLVRWVVKSVGLGWADRFLGAVFGLLKGCVLVTLGVMAVAAFLPGTAWLGESRFASYFLSVARQTALVTPNELSERIRDGVKLIRDAQPDWLKPHAEFAPGSPQLQQQSRT
jgi:membrane protein required for colicin V production